MQVSSPLLWVLLPFCLFVVAGALDVSSAADLISLFAGSTAGTVKEDIDVLQDLDFSETGLALPLGASTDGTCKAFSGTVRGHGHAIEGLVLGGSEFPDAGLFCCIKDATVVDLVIGASCSFTGSSAGALSITVNGSVVLKNVVNKAAVSGSDSVGGLIGLVNEQKQGQEALTFDGCRNEGSVSGVKSVGGFLGSFANNSAMDVFISNSVNSFTVFGETLEWFLVITLLEDWLVALKTMKALTSHSQTVSILVM